MASSSDIESRPPDTASTNGRSEPSAASRAHSTTSGSAWYRIVAVYCAPRARQMHSLWIGSVYKSIFSAPYLRSRSPEIRLETHGPLGTLWVGLGLCAFYIALVWINTLLGFVLTPLYIVPATWLMDKVKGKAPVRG